MAEPLVRVQPGMPKLRRWPEALVPMICFHSLGSELWLAADRRSDTLPPLSAKADGGAFRSQ